MTVTNAAAGLSHTQDIVLHGPGKITATGDDSRSRSAADFYIEVTITDAAGNPVYQYTNVKALRRSSVTPVDDAIKVAARETAVNPRRNADG